MQRMVNPGIIWYTKKMKSAVALFLLIFTSVPHLSSETNSDSIPIFPDLVYEYRITELNHLTPIELDYNKYVRRYIDVYTIEQREHMAKIAGRARKYFPMIEQKLDKYNLPHELKYLAIVESALDPFAVSKSGAVGLWQFKLNTGRMFDLKVNSYIDERRDPYKSTEAACKYFKYLYRIYEDWQLALAAYNGGPGVVRKAIARAGGKKSFWELYSYLPSQTKGYVPAFIAVNYAMNYLEKHKIVPNDYSYQYEDLDTLQLNYAVSFENIADRTELSVNTLKELNPVYRRDFIPNMNREAVLILPKNKVVKYLKNEDNIFESKTNYEIPGEKIGSTLNDTNKKMIKHIVKKGEYFHKIAMKYNCTIKDIKKWNDLPDNNLKVGQKLKIWVDSNYIKRIEKEKIQYRKKKEANTNKRVVFYTVQKGDTIWSIANKFNCESISDLIKANDIQDETDLKPGNKLKIYLDH
jgi:membrane-bound lytic murein transglycosylase D